MSEANEKNLAASNTPAAPVKKINVKQLTGIGLLTAIVIVLQLLAIAIRPTGVFNISLVLVPIVVGAALYGYKAGAWLGFVFGVVVTITDSAAFMVVNAPGTIATCVLKGLLAGLVSGLVYKLIEKKNMFAAAMTSAIVCPIVNTGVFLLGCLVFFMPTINGWAEGAGFADAGTYLIVGMVGVNFLIEMGINFLLSSVIVTIIKLAKKAK